jgi:dolichol-phosphate mannosyltransferase
MLCNLVVRIFFGKPASDVLSGYRAIKTEVFRELGLKSRHFEIEAEMTARAFSKGLTIAEVPITYRRRRGKSTKLKPFRDGSLILRTLILEVLHK